MNERHVRFSRSAHDVYKVYNSIDTNKITVVERCKEALWPEYEGVLSCDFVLYSAAESIIASSSTMM